MTNKRELIERMSQQRDTYRENCKLVKATVNEKAHWTWVAEMLDQAIQALQGQYVMVGEPFHMVTVLNGMAVAQCKTMDMAEAEAKRMNDDPENALEYKAIQVAQIKQVGE